MEVLVVSQIKTGRRGAAVLAPVHPLVGSAVAKRFIVAGTAPFGVRHGGDGGQVPRHRALRWRIDEHHIQPMTAIAATSRVTIDRMLLLFMVC